MKKNSIKIRIGEDRNGEQIFKTIIAHPMETGYRRDKRSGGYIPADYIEDFRVSVDGEPFIELVLGENVSKNPYLSFTFTKPLIENQKMEVYWQDNNKKEVKYEFVLKLNPSGRFGFSGEKKGSQVMGLTPEPLPVCKDKLPTATH